MVLVHRAHLLHSLLGGVRPVDGQEQLHHQSLVLDGGAGVAQLQSGVVVTFAAVDYGGHEGQGGVARAGRVGEELGEGGEGLVALAGVVHSQETDGLERGRGVVVDLGQYELRGSVR